ncbi:Ig-like domain-containing protein [Mesorhizobium atlanticum]
MLTVQADGSCSYKAFANTSGTDVFTYTIKDGDGDTSPSTLTINVTNGQPQRPVAATGQVDESGLATIGSHAGDPAHPITATGNLTPRRIRTALS